MLKITEPEYILMKKYIEEHCAIHLDKDKEYLIESRLYDLLVETGCKSFQEFHLKARTDSTGELRDRIVDAMTTNETMWFRDDNYWEYIERIMIPKLLNIAETKGKASIWSAAVSTGQEIFSLMILLDQAVRRSAVPSLWDRIDVLASDISSTALSVASSGRYDAISMNRGLQEKWKERYFTKVGKYWEFDSNLRQRVKFMKFNLQNPFIFFKAFDMVLCRNVSIYFSDIFKRKLFSKMARTIKPGGVLILGSTETLRDYSTDFDIEYYKNAVINIKK